MYGLNEPHFFKQGMPIYKLTSRVSLVGWPGVIYEPDKIEFPLIRNVASVRRSFLILMSRTTIFKYGRWQSRS